MRPLRKPPCAPKIEPPLIPADILGSISPVKRFIGYISTLSLGLSDYLREGQLELQLLVLRRCRSILKIFFDRGVHLLFGS